MVKAVDNDKENSKLCLYSYIYHVQIQPAQEHNPYPTIYCFIARINRVTNDFYFLERMIYCLTYLFNK